MTASGMPAWQAEAVLELTDLLKRGRFRASATRSRRSPANRPDRSSSSCVTTPGLFGDNGTARESHRHPATTTTMTEIPQQQPTPTPVPTQRYKLTIAYRGTRYHGWQAQPAMDTYKGDAAAAPARASRRSRRSLAARDRRGRRAPGRAPRLVAHRRRRSRQGAGRALRHAERSDPASKACAAPSTHRLPADILIRTIEPVPDAFDAVRSTSQQAVPVRHLEPQGPPGLLQRPRVAPLALPRRAEDRAGRRALRRQHDFASFARPGPQRESTVRTILACDVHWRKPQARDRRRGQRVSVEHGADHGRHARRGRAWAGTSPTRSARCSPRRTARAAGPTAPPHGLYLQWIRFKPLVPAPGDADLLQSGAPNCHPSTPTTWAATTPLLRSKSP